MMMMMIHSIQNSQEWRSDDETDEEEIISIISTRTLYK
jgi:hypothetical protein